MIIEGIERSNRDLAGLPERVLIVRDRTWRIQTRHLRRTVRWRCRPLFWTPKATQSIPATVPAHPRKISRSILFQSRIPDYKPAVISVKPSERELWRVLNASAITYLNLQVIYNGAAQALGVVAIDGVPINQTGIGWRNSVLWQSHLGLPPGGRMEFILKSPASGVNASLVTRSVNTGAVGENDPERPLATIEASENSPEPQIRLSSNPEPITPRRPRRSEMLSRPHASPVFLRKAARSK